MELKWMFLVEKRNIDGLVLKSWLDTTIENCKSHLYIELVPIIDKPVWNTFVEKVKNTDPKAAESVSYTISQGSKGSVKVTAIPIHLNRGMSVHLIGGK